MQGRTALFIGTFIALTATAVTTAISNNDMPVYQGYTAGQDTHYQPRSSTAEEGYLYNTFTFSGVDDNKIPVSVAPPMNQDGPLPAIIMLYGSGQKMSFLKDIAGLIAPQGFAVYMMEQHQRGERQAQDSSALSEFLGLRRRATLNMIETRRLLDTLAQRPEIDSSRIYLWGISFGTITGIPTFSLEPRFKGAIFSIGGGDIQHMFTSSKMYEDGSPLEKFQSHILAWYFSPADPLLYADSISGRPLLFQNALQDEIIPRRSAQALHAAVGQPKEITWYDTDHEGEINDQAVNYFIDGVNWIKKQEGLPSLAQQ